MGTFLSIIFWGPVILIFIAAIFSGVSNTTNGMMRRTYRKNKYKAERNSE